MKTLAEFFYVAFVALVALSRQKMPDSVIIVQI